MEFIIAGLTLTFLEIVLGVDNIIFISIVTNRLPEEQQPKARTIGLSLALVLRVILLITIAWIIHHLTNPLFTINKFDFSIRELVLFAGGLFLLGKSVSEIHSKLEGFMHSEKTKTNSSFRGIILQILLLDLIFSFDSILTAVGLTEEIMVMIVAVIIAMIVMMIFSGKISNFIAKNPTLEILALSFLILIGFMLVLEGFHIEIPKGYIYFAVFFSLIVEVINIRIRRNFKKREKTRKNAKTS